MLMIESQEIADALPHHKQKLVLVFSAMRHFAEELRGAGFTLDYRKTAGFAEGVREHLEATGATTLEVIDPTDWGVREVLEEAAGVSGAKLQVHENELWLTSEGEFNAWADGKKALRLEYFYRDMRKRFGWLMSEGKPVGGTWNYDADNRQTPEAGHLFPGMRRFPPDALTGEVIAEVAARWPGHFGSLEGFAWPVTREQALGALDDFLEHRLKMFGPFEDAMVEGEAVLYHSLLSIPLNLGLLHPLEVCERALAHAAVPEHDVPIHSIEGFLRQILGWREFIRHIYRRTMPALRDANGLEHTSPLPEAYWGAPTRMRCLSEAVRQLTETGHTHHIQRLMVLGNFALVAGVDPRELNDWFLTCYVDALDWVVTPNVMGMSQYADLGSFTSKPYAASGKYVDRMSDHCRGCAYDPKRTVGPGACPLNSLYWTFIDRHRHRFESNPRMAVIVRGWIKRDPAVRSDILAHGASVLDALRSGSL